MTPKSTHSFERSLSDGSVVSLSYRWYVLSVDPMASADACWVIPTDILLALRRAPNPGSFCPFTLIRQILTGLPPICKMTVNDV